MRRHGETRRLRQIVTKGARTRKEQAPLALTRLPLLYRCRLSLSLSATAIAVGYRYRRAVAIGLPNREGGR